MHLALSEKVTSFVLIFHFFLFFPNAGVPLRCLQMISKSVSMSKTSELIPNPTCQGTLSRIWHAWIYDWMVNMSCTVRNGLDGILLGILLDNEWYMASGIFGANRPNINSVSSSLTEGTSLLNNTFKWTASLSPRAGLATSSELQTTLSLKKVFFFFYLCSSSTSNRTSAAVPWYHFRYIEKYELPVCSMRWSFQSTNYVSHSQY